MPAARLPAHTATSPTLKVEAAWNVAPMTVPVRTDWTNETGNLREYDRSDGRGHEMDVFQAATCTLQMGGAGRAYDALNHNYIKARRRMRVTAFHPDLDRYSILLPGATGQGPMKAAIGAWPTTEITWECWVLATDAAAGTSSAEYVCSYAVAGQLNEFSISDLGALVVAVKGTTQATGVNVLTDGDQRTWARHLAVSWRSSDGLLRVFVDGVKLYEIVGFQTGVSMTTGGTLVVGNSQSAVGTRGTTATDWLNGQIREIRVWQVVRSQQAVYGDIYRSLAGSEANLNHYWRGDDGSGATAANSDSTNTDALTLSGSETWGTMTGFRRRCEMWIERIDPGYVIGDRDLPVKFTLTDSLGILAKFPTVVSPARRTMLDLSPYLLWSCDELSGQALDLSGNGRVGDYSDGAARGIFAPYPEADSRLGVGLNPGEYVQATDATVAQFERTQAFSVMVWCRFVGDVDQLMSSAGRPRIVGNIDTSTTANRGWLFDFRSFGWTVMLMNDNAANNALYFDGWLTCADHEWHLAGFSYDGTSSQTTSTAIYVDGNPIPLTGSGAALTATIVSAGNRLHVGPASSQTGDYIEVGELAIFTSVLSAAQFKAAYNDAVAPWRSQRSHVRIGKYLDLVGWPAAKRDLWLGSSTVAPVTEPIGSVLDDMQGVASVLELGAVLSGRDGSIRFDGREANSFDTPVAWTFGDDRTTDDCGYADLKGPLVDAMDQATHVTTQRTPDGPEFKVNDATAITDFIGREVEIRGPWADDQQPREVGIRVLNRLKTTTTRFSEMLLTGDPKNWTPVLSTRMNRDRVAVVRRIRDTAGNLIGSPISINCWVEAVSESYRPDQGFILDKMGLVPDDGSATNLARVGASVLDGTAVLA